MIGFVVSLLILWVLFALIDRAAAKEIAALKAKSDDVASDDWAKSWVRERLGESWVHDRILDSWVGTNGREVRVEHYIVLGGWQHRAILKVLRKGYL